MKHYELLAILPGTLTEAEVTPMVDSLKETIEKFGGAEITAHDMGKSRLAYPMAHIRYGYFFLLHFTADVAKINEIKNRLDLVSGVLRIVIRTYDPDKKPVDTSKLNLTPIANVVGGTDGETPTREPRRETISPVTLSQKVGLTSEEATTTETPVNVTDIEEKLDQILEKDLEKV